MRDHLISQAEVDALIQGLSGQSRSRTVRSMGADDLLALRERLGEFAHRGVAAVADLSGSACDGALADITTGTMREVSTLGAAQVLVGRFELSGGLGGPAYYVVPYSLAQRMAAALPAFTHETDVEQLAQAFAALLGKLNDGGWPQVAASLVPPIFTSRVEVAVAASLAASLTAIGHEISATPVISAGIDLAVGDAMGRLLLVIPNEVIEPLLAAIRGAAAEPVSALPSDPATAPAAAAPAQAAPSASADTPVGAVPVAALPVSPAANAPAVAPSVAPLQGRPPRNLDLLMDVVVRVTVELGRTRRDLRDVLNLGPGAVIELDRLANEPVDVMVNGKPVATAEVVVVDENYGVRVSAILSPEQRVRSLG